MAPTAQTIMAFLVVLCSLNVDTTAASWQRHGSAAPPSFRTRALRSAFRTRDGYGAGDVKISSEPLLFDLEARSHPQPVEGRIMSRLLRFYDRRVRPIATPHLSVNVSFGLALSQIIDVDEKNQILTTNCWLNQQWVDYQLTWDPEEFDNVTVIHMPLDTIWTPDILLYNNADVMTYIGAISTNAIVNHKGNVTWLSMMIFKSSCSIDVKYFPFDQQNCSMFFASWTYDGWMVNVVGHSEDGDASNYIENSEWHLEKIRQVRELKFFSCCPDVPYPGMHYFIVIKRRPLFYVFNMMLPCILITFVALLGFYIPCDSGEKVTMGITTLLSMTVFLMMVADSMPPTKNQLPLLGLFYGFTIVVVSCATGMTVLTLNIHNKGKQGIRVPLIFRQIIFGPLSLITFYKPNLMPLSCHDMKIPLARQADSVRFRQTHMHNLWRKEGQSSPDEHTKFPPKTTRRPSDLSTEWRNQEDCNHHQGAVRCTCVPSTDKSTGLTPTEIQTARVMGKIERLLSVNQEKEIEEEVRVAIDTEWQEAARVIDRCLLIVFVGVTVGVTVGISLQAPNQSWLFGGDDDDGATNRTNVPV